MGCINCFHSEEEIANIKTTNLRLSQVYNTHLITNISDIERIDNMKKKAKYSRHCIGYGGNFVFEKEFQTTTAEKTKAFKMTNLNLNEREVIPEKIDPSKSLINNILINDNSDKDKVKENSNNTVDIFGFSDSASNTSPSPTSIKKTIKVTTERNFRILRTVEEEALEYEHECDNNDKNKKENSSKLQMKVKNVINNLNEIEKNTQNIENLSDRILTPTPINSMCEDLFNEINELRTDPKNYIKKIQLVRTYITESNNKDNWNEMTTPKSWIKQIKYKIDISNICKVGLNKGQEQFDAVCFVLNTLQGMDCVEFQQDLCIELPDELEKIANREDISKVLSDISNIGKYKDLSFHYDIGINNSIVSTVLQIIDDSPFRGLRMKNLVKSSKRYIGISVKIIEDIRCVYILMAE